MGKRFRGRSRGPPNKKREILSHGQKKHLKEFGELHPAESKDTVKTYSKVEDTAEDLEPSDSSSETEEEDAPLKALLSLVGTRNLPNTESLDDDDDESDDREEEENAGDIINSSEEEDGAEKKSGLKDNISKDATQRKDAEQLHAIGKALEIENKDGSDEEGDEAAAEVQGDVKVQVKKNGEEIQIQQEYLPDDDDDDGDDKLQTKDEVLEEDGVDDELLEDGDSDDQEDLQLKEDDPFSVHFECDLPEDVVEKLSSTSKWQTKDIKVRSVGEGQVLWKDKSLVPKFKKKEKDLKKLGVKHKLINQVAVSNTRHCGVSLQTLAGEVLTPLQHGLFSVMNKYQDLLYPRLSMDRLEETRLTYCLHCLNHVLKTRSRVVAHNTKLKARAQGSEEVEYRDQGLTRPKVLIVLPTRHAAYRVVTVIVSLLSSSDQVMVSSRKRFKQEYGDVGHDDDKKGLKPDDFDILFAGNPDEDFRIGLSVSKKSLRLYSPFYMSDIIIASPLSLHRTIGHDLDKDRDYDFLSSIEILVLDQTDFFLMQNWDHILHLMTHMHLQPKQSHGVDFSRTRMWMLNGWAQHYRQMIIFSWVLVPPILALANKFCFNYAGKVQIQQSSTSGSICQVVVQLPQMFHKIECRNFPELKEKRFDYFLSEVLPQHQQKDMRQTLIFIPDYFDYCRLRNYLKKEAFSFAHISEYADSKEIRAARRTFKKRKAHFLLYTERLHFYRRFKLRGPRHIIFYELPTFPHFYSEMCNMLEEPGRFSRVAKETLTCTVMYSAFDALKLRQVVGTTRADHMLQSDKTVHMMVSGDS